MTKEPGDQEMTSLYTVVLTTVDSRDAARRIADELLRRRLAACVQILGPIISKYWWKGRIEGAEEYLIFIKSRSDLYNELEVCLREVHPYEVPEIVLLPVKRGFGGYLRWMDSCLRKADESVETTVDRDP